MWTVWLWKKITKEGKRGKKKLDASQLFSVSFIVARDESKLG